MSRKVVSPKVLVALKDALVAAFWYKNDLRTFLTAALAHPRVLGELDWEGNKRQIVGSLIDGMTRKQDTFQGDLLSLITCVSDISDFSHLARLDDGTAKARAAASAVSALRRLAAGHLTKATEAERAEARREAAKKRAEARRDFDNSLTDLRKRYMAAVPERDHSARGYAMEKIIREVFALFDLDPKASFRIEGEQIDGAFSFQGTDYLVEVKWQARPVGAAALDSLQGKVGRKLDNTLGLFISIGGFSEEGVSAHSMGRPVMILMDGADLMAVLDARISLPDLLLRKRRHASQTGRIFLPVQELLG